MWLYMHSCHLPPTVGLPANGFSGRGDAAYNVVPGGCGEAGG